MSFLDPFNMQMRLDVVEQINSIFMYIQVINKTGIEKTTIHVRNNEKERCKMLKARCEH